MYEIYTVEHVISEMKQLEYLDSDDDINQEKNKQGISRFIKRQRILFRHLMRSFQTRRHFRAAL